MRRTQLICAIGIGLWSAMASGRQATNADALSPALRAHVQAEQFGIVTSIRGLPLGVRDDLQKLFGSSDLDIVDPGATFNVSNVSANAKRPVRRLIAAGCSPDHHCLVYYERGGTDHTWHGALFHWTPATTRFEGGGIAPAGLKTIDDVRKAILSGAIKGQAKFW
jgi:hypothetical protein